MNSSRSKSGKQAGRSSGPRTVAAALVAVAVLLLVAFGLARQVTTPRTASFTDLAKMAETGGAGSVRIDGERFSVVTASGETLEAVVDDPGARHDLAVRFASAGVQLDFTPHKQ